MSSFDYGLSELVKQDLITQEDAIRTSDNPNDMRRAAHASSIRGLRPQFQTHVVGVVAGADGVLLGDEVLLDQFQQTIVEAPACPSGRN